MTHTYDCDTSAPALSAAAADIKALWDADPSASKSRKDCMAIGGWGQTTQLTKEKRGILHAYLDGASVRVTTRSLYAHLLELASAPPRKVREPAARFKHKPRVPTPQELEALKRGNERRRREAEARRAAGREKETAGIS
jgi:hypothetical protein